MDAGYVDAWPEPPGACLLYGRARTTEGRMVPFKTPLDARYNDQVPPQFLFTPAMLMTWAESAEVRRNGLAHDAAHRGPCPT